MCVVRALLSLRVFRFVCAAFGPIASGAPVAATDTPAQPAAAGSGRIVHRFDFDERASGNLEDIPKYWLAFRPPGFPHFAQGRFDFEVGREAAPSFYLFTEGRSVAYHYTGGDTRVRANSEYRIEGYVRPDRLRFARAALSAHFLDKTGRPLAGTMVRSPYVGGPNAPERWERFELYLPAAPVEAHTIGLIAWVLQQPAWNLVVPMRRHIPRTDVHGGAWFDDITINALPRVELTTSAPGNVLAPGDRQELHVVLADYEPAGLVGRLWIAAADGEPVETRTIPVTTDEFVDPVHVSVAHLVPGLYRARLDALAGQVVIASRRLAFARLAPLTREPQVNGRSFGVVVSPGARAEATTELTLLRAQAVRSAKLPVWSGIAEDQPTVTQHRARDAEQHELLKSGFALTGVFFGPPSPIANRGGRSPRPLLELLASEPSVWYEHLAAVVAPRASFFHWWQVGADGDDLTGDHRQLTEALTQLREAMRRFITIPQLAIPLLTSVEPGTEQLPVEQLALTMGKELPLDQFAPKIKRFDSLGYLRTSACVEPLPTDRYRRLPRLADWAQRIITTRHSGADTVFVPQTWRVRETAHGWVTEPTEEYLILRTIADVIADALPAESLRVGAGVECRPFHDGDSTVVALWDPQAPPEGSVHAIQLGQASRQIDLWGRSSPLARDEHGRQIVRLSSLPVLVDGVDRWLIEFRTSFRLEPARLESGTELVRHTLEVSNPGSRVVSGHMYLATPRSWDVTPRTLSFNLTSPRAEQFELEGHYPHNEPAGIKQILAKTTLMTNSYYLEIPLQVEIGLRDVDVWGMAVIEGGELLLRQVVANRSSEVLHFRGSATVPGRERQYRPISGLGPGDTQMVEYRYARGAEFSGRRVRVGLREMDDGPRTHTLELLVP